MSHFPYKTVLMIGCTAGIGRALADRMIEHGSFVIGVGRRRERLDDFVSKHGPERAASSQFDITDLAAVGSWSADILARYPDVDCVVLNSGIQRALNFARPAEIDLQLVRAETTTNYTSYVHLLKYFVAHLQQRQEDRQTAVVAVSSGLGLVPMPRCANYCATKSALHSLMWSLRAQLAHDARSRNVRVVEIIPPAVQTELHEQQEDLRAQGDTNFGMPLRDFLEEAWSGLAVEGKDEIPVGMVRQRLQDVEKVRRERFDALVSKTMGDGESSSSATR